MEAYYYSKMDKTKQAVIRFDTVEAGSAPEARAVMEEANEGEKE